MSALSAGPLVGGGCSASLDSSPGTAAPLDAGNTATHAVDVSHVLSALPVHAWDIHLLCLLQHLTSAFCKRHGMLQLLQVFAMLQDRPVACYLTDPLVGCCLIQ